MKNDFFELALLKYLYSYYALGKVEEELKKGGVEPLLPNTAAASISQYFRFMNKIDYSKLSFREKLYIKKNFASIEDAEKHGEDERTVSIYKKIVDNIQLKPLEWLVYSCDGGVRKQGDHFSMSALNQMARANHVTFAIYYTQACDEDEEYQKVAELVANLVNALQREKDIDIVLFTEVQFYTKLAARI